MRGRSTSRNRLNNQQNFRSRSRSQNRIQNNVQLGARTRSRSRSRNQFQQNTRSRSRSRSQNRINVQQVNRRSRSRTPARATGIAARLGNRGQNRVYGKVGLRSDMMQSQIRSRTFSRSGSVPRNQGSYTVSVANDGIRSFPPNRRNSMTNGDAFQRSGPVTRMQRGRGRGRGRANGRIGFVNRQILDPEIQRAIAEMQGKVYQNGKISESDIDAPGINFFATPQTTMTKLSDRFTNL